MGAGYCSPLYVYRLRRNRHKFNVRTVTQCTLNHPRSFLKRAPELLPHARVKRGCFPTTLLIVGTLHSLRIIRGGKKERKEKIIIENFRLTPSRRRECVTFFFPNFCSICPGKLESVYNRLTGNKMPIEEANVRIKRHVSGGPVLIFSPSQPAVIKGH